MYTPPIADPNGVVFPSPPVTPTPEYISLAKALNRSIWMLPACIIFSIWDMSILGLIFEYFDNHLKPDDTPIILFIWAAGLLFLWLRVSTGLRLARKLGNSTLWLTGIGLALDLVNLAVFITLNCRAAVKLRTAGVKVGFFGVSRRELANLYAVTGANPFHRY